MLTGVRTSWAESTVPCMFASQLPGNYIPRVEDPCHSSYQTQWYGEVSTLWRGIKMGIRPLLYLLVGRLPKSV